MLGIPAGSSLQTSSTATSGPATTGNVGVSIGGINTGTQSQLPSWVWIAAIAAVGLWFLKRGR